MDLLPMLASNSLPFQEEGWQYERKVDGVRALVHIGRNSTTIHSRTLQDMTAQFPELSQLHERFRDYAPLTLDGEIIQITGDGSESLAGMQMRMGLLDPEEVERRRQLYPVGVVLFDMLIYRGQDITDVALDMRRPLLEMVHSNTKSLARNFEKVSLSQVLQPHELELVFQRGWEGVVAKKLDSIYEPGKRRSTWKKWKIEKTLDLKVVGHTPFKGKKTKGQGSPREQLDFGAAVVVDGDGKPRGHVGSGYTEEAYTQLMALLHKGLEPIIEVRYMGISKYGLLREPRFKSIRWDKTEADEIEEDDE